MEFDGKRLRDLRESKEITLEQLGEMMDRTKQTVSNWERNKTPPTLKDITRLGEVLGVPGSFFVTQTRGNTPAKEGV